MRAALLGALQATGGYVEPGAGGEARTHPLILRL